MSAKREGQGSVDTFNKEKIKSNLTSKIFGRPIVFKESLASTQETAHKLARQGAKHGTLIVAKEQTKARGRLNRPWHSVKNKAISMSLILRPKVSPNLSPQLTLYTATILAEVLREITQANIEIKWPNDLLIDGKKFVGILTEMKVSKGNIDYIILGTGINVNNEAEDLPLHTSYPTTSLFIETEEKWDRSKIIQNFLRHFEDNFPSFLESGFSTFKDRWEAYAYRLGDSLYLNDFKNKWSGRFKGISEDGGLLMENEEKKIVKIYSAEIEWYN